MLLIKMKTVSHYVLQLLSFIMPDMFAILSVKHANYKLEHLNVMNYIITSCDLTVVQECIQPRFFSKFGRTDDFEPVFQTPFNTISTAELV